MGDRPAHRPEVQDYFENLKNIPDRDVVTRPALQIFSASRFSLHLSPNIQGSHEKIKLLLSGICFDAFIPVRSDT